MYNFSKDIYYIEQLDVIFIARYSTDVVDVYDVLSEHKISFKDIEGYIVNDATRQVRFHFTPDWLNVDYDVVPRNDNALYVRGEFIDMGKCKFPETGVT